MNVECRTAEVKSTSKFDIVVFPVAHQHNPFSIKPACGVPNMKGTRGVSSLGGQGLPLQGRIYNAFGASFFGGIINDCASIRLTLNVNTLTSSFLQRTESRGT
jgi:hypothetical protein